MGALGGWVRVAAVRTALNLRRDQKPAEAEQPRMSPSEAVPDPELDFLKMRYRGEFEAAFGDALGALDSEERNVLRLHYLDGLNIDEIGALFKVHRTTVARWLAKSREQILMGTRRRLGERLRITDSELDSLIALVQSQLDVSLRRFLVQNRDEG
jgi:RNA polymerase sigma-70 factor (ECF subfamily)